MQPSCNSIRWQKSDVFVLLAEILVVFFVFFCELADVGCLVHLLEVKEIC